MLEAEEFAEQGVPDASLMRFSLYVQAIEAAGLHVEHDLIVVAMNNVCYQNVPGVMSSVLWTD